MPLFERRLIAPTDAELVAVLSGAERAAGERFRRGELEQVARESRRHAEGVRPLGDGARALFLVAWWTDHLGRRHYRVVAGKPEDDGGRQFRSLDGTRPPLWYVYPERVFCRSHEGWAEWRAACACGACGPPGALAWMGPCCGPCHDREQEGAAAPPPAVLGGPPGPVHALAFTPDDLFVAGPGQSLLAYALSTGRAETLVPPGDGPDLTALAVSPAGDAVAAGSEAGEVLTFDPRAGRWQQVGRFGMPVGGLEFSPAGAALAASAGEEEAALWRRGQGGGWERAQRPEAGTALAFAPQGDVLALGQPGGRVSLLDTGGWAAVRTFGTGAKVGHDVRLVAFAPGGHLLFTLSGPYTDTGWENFRGLLQAWDRGGREVAGYRAELPPLNLAAFSPDRLWLAWVVYDQQSSPAAVTFWDVRARRVRAALEWNPDDGLYCLAFSPDGRLLATGGQSGTVKLWPWRELLGA